MADNDSEEPTIGKAVKRTPFQLHLALGRCDPTKIEDVLLEAARSLIPPSPQRILIRVLNCEIRRNTDAYIFCECTLNIPLALRRDYARANGLTITEFESHFTNTLSRLVDFILHERNLEKAKKTDGPSIAVYVRPGNADQDTIRAVLESLNELHQACGGAGLQFCTDGTYIRTDVEALV